VGRVGDIALATQVAVFGNKRAFDQLVRQYQSPVRRFLLSQTAGNEALSDDLSSMLTWLMRIAYNVFYDYKRKTERQQADELDARIADQQSSPTLKTDLYQALALLKDEERSCITLQLIEGYRIDEIAGIMGIPSGTVKSHMKRGKDKLVDYLRQNGYDR